MREDKEQRTFFNSYTFFACEKNILNKNIQRYMALNPSFDFISITFPNLNGLNK